MRQDKGKASNLQFYSEKNFSRWCIQNYCKVNEGISKQFRFSIKTFFPSLVKSGGRTDKNFEPKVAKTRQFISSVPATFVLFYTFARSIFFC